MKDGAFVAALAIDGKMLSSEELAEFIDGLGVKGENRIQFIIGGSLGLSGKVLEQALQILQKFKGRLPENFDYKKELEEARAGKYADSSKRELEEAREA